MNLHSFLEKPIVYNLITKLLSLGNKSVSKFITSVTSDLSSGSLILDVGCGTGKYVKIFKGKFFGIDLNPEYIEYAKEHYSQGNFSVGDATDLEFSDNTFDFVFCNSILHHLSDEKVEKTIIEMKRVCKENGRILIIDAVYPRKINFLGYFLFKLDRGQYTRKLNELNTLLDKQGFKLIRRSVKGSFPYCLSVFAYQGKL